MRQMKGSYIVTGPSLQGIAYGGLITSLPRARRIVAFLRKTYHNRRKYTIHRLSPAVRERKEIQNDRETNPRSRS